MMKTFRLFFTLILGSGLGPAALIAQPTNLPAPAALSVTLSATNHGLLAFSTNLFASNLSLLRAAGVLAPTNPPADGRIPVATGNNVRWDTITNIVLGVAATGLRTNAITTNNPAAMTNVVLSIADNIPRMEGVGHAIPNSAAGGQFRLLVSDDDGTLVEWLLPLARTNMGAHNASNLTVGIVAPARLGLYSDQNVGGRFLRNDGTFQVISGSGLGDLLAANNLSDVANVGAARTNLAVHQASNITAGVIAPARLATNAAQANYILQATSASSARWTLVSAGAGDLLAANNLTDLADIGQARTNLGANSAANLTTGTLPPARLAEGATGGAMFMATNPTAGHWVGFTNSVQAIVAALPRTNALTTVLTNGVSVGSGVVTNINFVAGANTTITGAVVGATAVVGVSSTGSGGSQTPWLSDIDAAGYRLDNANGAGITNLVHSTRVQAGGVILASALTNESTGQYTFILTLNENAFTNWLAGLFGHCGETNPVVVSGFDPDPIYVLPRHNGLYYQDPGNNQRYFPDGYYGDVDGPHLRRNISSGLWEFLANGDTWIFTNSTLTGTYTIDVDPAPPGLGDADGQIVVGQTPCYEAGSPWNFVFGRPPILTQGFVVKSNAWTTPPALAEGDVWYTSSNGIPTTVRRLGGVNVTNNLVTP